VLEYVEIDSAILPCYESATVVKFAKHLVRSGSGFALIWLSWIRIRIGNADPDPEALKLNKIKNKTYFLPFKKTSVS
jgi:hypothetical protein